MTVDESSPSFVVSNARSYRDTTREQEMMPPTAAIAMMSTITFATCFMAVGIEMWRAPALGQ
jgi:hypothetical protein